MRNHLTQEERYQIYSERQIGRSLTEIGKSLGRHKSTISREIQRNTIEIGYQPKEAQAKADVRFKTSIKSVKLTPSVGFIIREQLSLDWSPEQISGRMRLEYKDFVCHESIYRYILEDKKKGGSLHRHLRCQKQRKCRYGSKAYDKRGQIKNRVSIDERSPIVDLKERFGDWEGDLVIGQNHKGAIVRLLKVEIVHTVTFDNGKEFSRHEAFGKKLEAQIFFAHPYSSWERGLNENTNGLIRQYFPKKSCFTQITTRQIKKVENALNNRPRKTLGYLTPNEIHLQKLAFKT